MFRNRRCNAKTVLRVHAICYSWTRFQYRKSLASTINVNIPYAFLHFVFSACTTYTMLTTCTSAVKRFNIHVVAVVENFIIVVFRVSRRLLIRRRRKCTRNVYLRYGRTRDGSAVVTAAAAGRRVHCVDDIFVGKDVVCGRWDNTIAIIIIIYDRYYICVGTIYRRSGWASKAMKTTKRVYYDLWEYNKSC